MAIIVPKERKHLSADALFRLVRHSFATLPDPRSDEVAISFTDALRSGFAMFSLTSPSLLAFDTQRMEGNVETISGIARVPCDTSMRARLDPVLPEVASSCVSDRLPATPAQQGPGKDGLPCRAFSLGA